MNLKQLEAFRTVMATGSTMAASSILHLSQSAISRQLSQLEADLGFELFLRVKGRLIPTPEAKALIDHVSDLTEVIGRVRRLSDDLRAGVAGQDLLKIAVPHSLAITVIPGIVRSFLAERPQIAIEILSGTYGDIERLVASRSADLGFIRLPPSDQAFEVRPLLTSEAACVMPRGHPLAELDVVMPRDLVDVDLILLGRQRALRHDIDASMRDAGVRARCRIEAHSVGMACALVAEGLGVSIVAAFMGRSFRGLPIDIRPFNPSVVNEFGIISLPDTPRSRAAEAFIEILREWLVQDATDTGGQSRPCAGASGFRPRPRSGPPA